MQSSSEPSAFDETIEVENVEALFKASMRRLAASVTIVTAGDVGMTATAVTSLSMEPPALLVCVNRSASIHAVLPLGASFCVNLLAGHHEDLSKVFGGKMSPEERLRYGAWARSDAGVPFLKDAQSNIFCTVELAIDYATHTIFIGKVQGVRLHGPIDPLIYGDGRFIRLPAAG